MWDMVPAVTPVTCTGKFMLLENKFLVNLFSCFSAATVRATDAGILLGRQYIIYLNANILNM